MISNHQPTPPPGSRPAGPDPSSIGAARGAAASPSWTRRQFVDGALLDAASVTWLRAVPEGLRWQIGCYTRPWADFEYRVALDGIAGAGFKFAGLMTAKGGALVTPDTPPEKVAEMGAEARARGLGVISVWGGNFMVRKSLADGIARLRRLIDHSALCRCPGLLLGGVGKPEFVDDYYKAVAECCDYAATKGVGLSVKPHGGTNSTGKQCRRLIAQVGHKNFGLWYDPGNIFYYSDGRIDPADDAADVDGLVVGVSIKDFRPPKSVDLSPGNGRVDFARVIARLSAGGFRRGPLVVECLDAGKLEQINAEAVKARRFLEILTGTVAR